MWEIKKCVRCTLLKFLFGKQRQNILVLQQKMGLVGVCVCVCEGGYMCKLSVIASSAGIQEEMVALLEPVAIINNFEKLGKV